MGALQDDYTSLVAAVALGRRYFQTLVVVVVVLSITSRLEY
jgi:hypothetical protein